MTKATIKRLFPKKQWCIKTDFGDGLDSYWEAGFSWYDKKHAYVGTKREM